MKEKLRAFITAELIKDAEYPLEADESIVKGGLIDSWSLATLGVFIEEQFGVFFPDPELTADNMDSLNQIYNNIQAKLNA